MSNKDKSLKVLAFMDGTPGHEKQTRGILKSLSKKIHVEIDFKQAKRVSPFHQVINWGKYFLSSPSKAKHSGAGYHFMIGTGTHTHLPMLLHKRKSHIPVVSCMTPSSALINDFDLLFVPKHDKVSVRDNTVTTVGPPSICENIGRHEDENILILVGGIDEKSHVWNSQYIVEQIDKLITSDKQRKFSISSSPRTPAETAVEIADLSVRYENVQFFKFEDTQPGWVENEYNRSKYVWVTGDSISMVYEALSSGCRVGIIPVKWRNINSKYLRSEKYLKERGYIVFLENYLEGQARWKNDNLLNESNRCADEIIRRWA